MSGRASSPSPHTPGLFLFVFLVLCNCLKDKKILLCTKTSDISDIVLAFPLVNSLLKIMDKGSLDFKDG